MDRAMWEDRAALVRRAGTLEPLADATLDRWLSPAFRSAHPDVAARLRANGAGARAARDHGADLVIAGRDDPSTPPQEGERIAAAIPGARFELSAARRVANVEAEAVVTELIRGHVVG